MVFGACSTPQANDNQVTRSVRLGYQGGPFARVPWSGAHLSTGEAPLASTQNQPSACEEIRRRRHPLDVGHLRVVDVGPALPHRPTGGAPALGEARRHEEI